MHPVLSYWMTELQKVLMTESPTGKNFAIRIPQTLPPFLTPLQKTLQTGKATVSSVASQRLKDKSVLLKTQNPEDPSCRPESLCPEDELSWYLKGSQGREATYNPPQL